MFAHSKLDNLCYQKKRERAKIFFLDVSVGGLLLIIGDLTWHGKSLIKLIETPRLLGKGEVDSIKMYFPKTNLS